MTLSFPISYCNRLESLGISPAIKAAGWRSHMDSTTRQKDKIIVIMGATGTGKSRLSIELATQFPSEVVNSDKMQVYKGLDITTNKIPMHDRLGVPHHLFDEFDSLDGELTPAQFRLVASSAVASISTRSRLPLLVGGSNSFIHALVVDRFNYNSDVFDGLHSISSELRYNCCFLWVDVQFAVLSKYLSRRVDEMIDSGMFHELAAFYESDSVEDRVGIRKAIGVPEFDRFFRSFPPGEGGVVESHLQEDLTRRMLFKEAVEAIKDNTLELAKRQIAKILLLRSAGWNLQRLDATNVFRAVLRSDSGKSSEIWEMEVVEPSVKIVRSFLDK
ncbi:hypothetical protein HHK36_014982 [Tetracentron sinense]|uniref:Adenylate isopentenyltransferase n=1 Tax=Tetracentron sinense TaxID=13715 RepID=A0A834Z3T7_TETSI|nr:hypothetical protein HHK36_014982 [Tetracentron sinense]